MDCDCQTRIEKRAHSCGDDFGITIRVFDRGAVVVEPLFALPGLGSYGLPAILSRDYMPVQGFILFVAFAFTCSNMLVDLIYALLDPRIRYNEPR